MIVTLGKHFRRGSPSSDWAEQETVYPIVSGEGRMGYARVSSGANRKLHPGPGVKACAQEDIETTFPMLPGSKT
jgi:hypothetical protein